MNNEGEMVMNEITKDYYEKINGTNLFFHTKTYDENAPYILFFNGGPGDISIKERAIVEVLSTNLQWNKNIIFFDQRGCGKSDRLVDKESFTFENLVTDSEALKNFVIQKKCKEGGNRLEKKSLIQNNVFEFEKSGHSPIQETPELFTDVLNEIFSTLNNN